MISIFIKWLFVVSCLLILSFNAKIYAQDLDIKVETSDFQNTFNNYIDKSFVRQYTIVNNALQPFNGYVKIQEQNGSALSVSFKLISNSSNSKITVVQPAGITTNDLITNGKPFGNGTSEAIVLQLTNFINGTDKIEVNETVTITGCLNVTDESNQTDFDVFYGSSVNTFVSIPDASNIHQVHNAGGKPYAMVTPVSGSYNPSYPGKAYLNPSDYFCPDNQKRTYSFIFRNDPSVGDGATLRDVNLIFANDDQLFTIDRESIVIEKYEDNNSSVLQQWDITAQTNALLWSDHQTQLPIDRDPNTDITSDNCLPASKRFYRLRYIIGNLKPNEYLKISLDIYNCEKSTNLSVEFNNKVVQFNDFIYYEATSDCSELYYNWGGFSSPYYDGGDYGFYLDPVVKQSPSQMAPQVNPTPIPDIDNFGIEIPFIGSPWSYYGRMNYGMMMNFQNAELIVRLNSDLGLQYTAYNESDHSTLAGIYDHLNNPRGEIYYPSIKFVNKLQNSQVWHPVDEAGSIINIAGGSTNQREFHFRISDLPAIMGISSTPTTAQIQSALYDFLNNSRLYYSMEATCEGSDYKNWNVEIWLKTDNCSNGDMYPVSKLSEYIDVVCPGCKVPGAAVRGGAVQRTNYGAYDFDNDGLPDAGESMNSTHTLDEIVTHNIASGDPLQSISTTNGSVGDMVEISTDFYLTAPSDCSVPDADGIVRSACHDNELQYKWAYLQVIVPHINSDKSVFDNSISGLEVYYNSIPVPSDKITFSFYNIPGNNNSLGTDYYYFKISQDFINSNGGYYKSLDALSFKFRVKIVENAIANTPLAVQYKAYFTKDEEVVSDVSGLQNRSYADCVTDEKRGMKNSNDLSSPWDCNTQNLQMICEGFGSKFYLIHLEEAVNLNSSPGITTDASCPKTVTGGWFNNHYGKPNIQEVGLNEYLNEIRVPPYPTSFVVPIPKGYVLDSIKLDEQRINNYPSDYGVVNSTILPSTTFMSSNDISLNNDFSSDRVISVNIPQSLVTLANYTFDPNYHKLPVDQRNLLVMGDEYYDFKLNFIYRPVCSFLLSQNPQILTSVTEPVIGGVKSDLTMTTTSLAGTVETDLFTADPSQGWEFYTPYFSADPFVLSKQGASGNEYPIQTQTDFIHKMNLVANFPNHPTLGGYRFSYVGDLFFAIDPKVIANYYDEFKVSIAGIQVIDWKITSPNDNTFGVYRYTNYYPAGPPEVVISGKLNVKNLDCSNELKTVFYDLIYGLKCDPTISIDDILSGNVCQKWAEHVDIDLGIVGLDRKSTSPVIGQDYATHHVIYTALRSQITDTKLTIVNDKQNVTFSNYKIYLRNDQTGSTIDLLPSSTITTLADQSQEITINLENYFFMENTPGKDWYDQLHLEYTINFQACSQKQINTTITDNSKPFYSSTQCPLIGSTTIQSDIVSQGPLITGISTGESYCADHAPIIITPQFSGGTFTGPVTINSDGTATFTPSAAGAHIIEYSFTEQNGCSNSQDVTVTVNPLPYMTLTSDAGASFLCSSPITLTASNQGGGTPFSTQPYYDLLWSDNSTGDHITVSTAGVYTVTITDANGCSNVYSSSVIDHLEALCPDPVCPGENPPLTLTNTNGVTGTYVAGWFKAGDVSMTMITSITEEGDYYAMAAPPNIVPACTLTTEGMEHWPCHVSFKHAPLPYTLSTTGISGICPGDQRTITVTNPTVNDLGNTSVVWTTSKTDLTDLTVTEPGTYYITATDMTTSCRTESNKIAFYGPVISLDRECYEGNKVKLTAGSNIFAGNYQWYQIDEATGTATPFSALNPPIVPVDPPVNSTVIIDHAGLYKVTNDVMQQCNTSRVIYEPLILTAAPNANIISDADGRFEGMSDGCNNGGGFVTDFNCITVFPDNDPNTTNINYSDLPSHYMISNDVTSPPGMWNRNYWTGQSMSASDFMLVDGETKPGDQIVWKKTVPVQHGVRYLLKGNITNIDVNGGAAKEIPEVEMRITYIDANGFGIRHDLGVQILYNNASPTWVEIRGLTSADAKVTTDNSRGEAVNAIIELIMKGGGAIGRDIGVDNISLTPVGLCDDVNSITTTIASNDRISALSFVTLDFEELHTCNGAPVTFKVIDNSSTNSLVYTWNILVNGIPDHTVGTESSLTVSPNQTTSYQLIVYDPISSAYFRKVVTVYVENPVLHITSSADNICQTTPILFSVDQFTGIGNIGYQWYVDGQAVAGANSSTYSLTTLNKDNVPVKCELINQCKDHNNNPLVVYSNTITIEGPMYTSGFLGNDVTICSGANTTLAVTPITNATSYLWSTGETTSSITVSNAGTYSVNVTDLNGCANADNLVVSVNTCVPNTQVTSSLCDKSYSITYGNLSCLAVVNANLYEFRFRDPNGNIITRQSTTNSLQIGSSTVQYLNWGTTYTVDVRARVGTDWGDFNVTCLIYTVPDPSIYGVPNTQVNSAYCNKSYSPTSGSVNCIIVDGASHYEFRFTDGSGNVITKQYTSATAIFSAISPILSWGTSYIVDVRAQIGNVWGSFATTCAISMVPDPSIYGVPATQIGSFYCNKSYNVNQTTGIAATAVSGADLYEFRFRDGVGNTITKQWTSSSIAMVNINSPSLSYGTTYTVDVRAHIGSVWGNFATTCTIITNPASKLAVNSLYEEEQIIIYPNPTEDQFNISIPGNEDETVVLEIFNMDGVSVYKDERFRKAILQQIGSNLSSGVYVLRISDHGTVRNFKLVVTR